jgi:alkylhydroperoxidase family enzyme
MDIHHAVGGKAGIPEAKLEALEAYADSPWFSERERAALAFCEDVIRDDHEVSDVSEARLRAHFSEAEQVELTFIIGYQVFASKFAKAFRLPPQGFTGRRPAAPRR